MRLGHLTATPTPSFQPSNSLFTLKGPFFSTLLAVAQLSVRVRAGVSRDELSLEGDVLHVRLTAHAVEGQANRRLIRLLARRLSVRQADVVIVRGHASRDKLIEVAGVSDAELRARL